MTWLGLQSPRRCTLSPSHSQVHWTTIDRSEFSLNRTMRALKSSHRPTHCSPPQPHPKKTPVKSEELKRQTLTFICDPGAIPPNIHCPRGKKKEEWPSFKKSPWLYRTVQGTLYGASPCRQASHSPRTTAVMVTAHVSNLLFDWQFLISSRCRNINADYTVWAS